MGSTKYNYLHVNYSVSLSYRHNLIDENNHMPTCSVDNVKTFAYVLCNNNLHALVYVNGCAIIHLYNKL